MQMKLQSLSGANFLRVWWQKWDIVRQRINLSVVGLEESWRQTYAERNCPLLPSPTVHEMELTRSSAVSGLAGENDIAFG